MERNLLIIVLACFLPLSKPIFSLDETNQPHAKSSLKKVALVIGATSGIGEATAIMLANKGIKVVVAGRRKERGEKVVEKIRADGGEAHYIFADISNEGNIRQLITETVELYGTIDIAVNNAAAVSEYQSLAECDSTKFMEIIQTNIMGTFCCMKYEIQQMLLQGKGVIINVSSRAGVKASPKMSTYCATKHAIQGLTLSAALEYASQNIRINAIAPGGVDTEMINNFATSNDMDPKVFLSKLASNYPMQRIGTIQEIAYGICWLASDEASFVTGHTLCIDGGANAK